MSKSITGITDTEIKPFYAVEMQFDSGTLRFWTGYGDITLESNTYTGTGDIMAVDLVEETSDLSAKSATITMQGVTSEIVALALTEPYQGRVCRILFGIEGQAPVEIFGGFMDVMTIEDSGEASVISLTIESRLVELERTRPIRYTDESHKSRNAGDSYFSYVASLIDKDVVWGRAKA